MAKVIAIPVIGFAILWLIDWLLAVIFDLRN